MLQISPDMMFHWIFVLLLLVYSDVRAECELEILNGDSGNVIVSSPSSMDDHPPSDALAYDDGVTDRYWMAGSEDETTGIFITVDTMSHRQISNISFKVRQSYFVSIRCGSNSITRTLGDTGHSDWLEVEVDFPDVCLQNKDTSFSITFYGYTGNNSAYVKDLSLKVCNLPEGCVVEILSGESSDVEASSPSSMDGHPPSDALKYDDGAADRYWRAGPEDDTTGISIKLNTVGHRLIHVLNFKVRQSYFISINCGGHGFSHSIGSSGHDYWVDVNLQLPFVCYENMDSAITLTFPNYDGNNPAYIKDFYIEACQFPEGCVIGILNGDSNDVEMSATSYVDGHPPSDALDFGTSTEDRYWQPDVGDGTSVLYIKLNTVASRQVYMIVCKVRQWYYMEIHCGGKFIIHSIGDSWHDYWVEVKVRIPHECFENEDTRVEILLPGYGSGNTPPSIKDLSLEVCVLPTTGPCDDFDCPNDAMECVVNRAGKPKCKCPSCRGVAKEQVCGKIGKKRQTFKNLCELKRKACTQNKSYELLYDGRCTDDASH
ncbi:hypothetical protein ScPMuIL_009011 [Solemya velum]